MLLRQACLNGARPADAHPELPVTPHHLARDAREVHVLGIKSVHVHPRCSRGLETLEPMHVGDTVAAIHAAVPGIEVSVPAARWVQPDWQRRVEAVMEWGRLGDGKPDVIAVNVHDYEWRKVCAAAYSMGIGLELGVWTAADAVSLSKAGIPEGTVRLVAEPTVSSPHAAVAEVTRLLRVLSPFESQGFPVLVHGEEEGAWPVLQYALKHKKDTRIGFEDALITPDEWLANDNKDMVQRAKEFAAREA